MNDIEYEAPENFAMVEAGFYIIIVVGLKNAKMSTYVCAIMSNSSISETH